MLVAKIIDGAVVELQDYRTMFPDTSFPTTGPNSEFFAENNLMPVCVWKAHDAATEELVPCDPYIENDQVYTVQVQPKAEVNNAG